jgi:NADH:ubiquinone oxidoreductase subunit 3 (subunit A)
MKKTALAIALVLILSSAVVFVFASPLLSNPGHPPNETAPYETEPSNPTEPPNPTQLNNGALRPE